MKNNLSNQPLIEKGHQYRIRHQFLGTFKFNIIEVDRPWLTGRIPGERYTRLINMGLIKAFKLL